MILQALFTRPVRRRPLRFLATILGVAAGVAAVVATLCSSRAALSSLRQGVLELSGRTALEVTRAGGVDEDELVRLAPLANDAWIAPVVDRPALCRGIGDSVRLFGIDPLVDARVRDLGSSLGAGIAGGVAEPLVLALLRGEGACVSEALASELRLSIGDALDLVVAGRPARLPILATFPGGKTSVLDRLVVVDVALAERLAGSPGTLDRIELVPRKGVDRGALRDLAVRLVSPGVQVEAPDERVTATSGVVRSLDFNLTALSSISLLVGAVLVATTLATSVVQRRRTIALLYSIGASRPQVMRAVLVEALAIGVIGSLLGVVLGFAGARFLVDGMRQTLSAIVSTTAPGAIRFGLDHALAGFALGLVSALFSALLPLIEGSRTPPLQALRGEAPSFLAPRSRRIALALSVACLLVASECARLPAYQGLPVMAVCAALAILAALFTAIGPALDLIGRRAGARLALPVWLRLACAGLSAGRRRAAWAAGAVGIAVALSISIATFVISFRSTFEEWTRTALKADLAVRPPSGRFGFPIGRLDPALLDLVRDAAGRDAVEPYFSSRAMYGSQVITLGATHFAVAARRAGASMLDGSDARAALMQAWKQHEVLVSEAGARRFGWKRGDAITIEARGQPLVRRVAGVFRDYADSQGTVVIDEDDFRALFPRVGPNYVDVYCASRADAPAAREAIEKALSGFDVEILDNHALRASVLVMFDRTFEITQALALCAAAVAVLAVLSVLFALVAERGADLALLAAIGAAPSQVRAVVCAQAGLLGALGSAGGALAGLLIGFLLVAVVNLQSFGWAIEFVRPWSTLATTALVVGLACVAAGLVPARSAARSRLSGALREEG